MLDSRKEEILGVNRPIPVLNTDIESLGSLVEELVVGPHKRHSKEDGLEERVDQIKRNFGDWMNRTVTAEEDLDPTIRSK